MIIHPMFPAHILTEMESVISDYKGRTMPVYAEAEQIRQRWSVQNIALEDYVDQLVKMGANQVGFEFDPHQAADSLLGVK